MTSRSENTQSTPFGRVWADGRRSNGNGLRPADKRRLQASLGQHRVRRQGRSTRMAGSRVRYTATTTERRPQLLRRLALQRPRPLNRGSDSWRWRVSLNGSEMPQPRLLTRTRLTKKQTQTRRAHRHSSATSIALEATDPTRTPTRGSETVDPATHHLRSPTAHATAQSAIAAARRRSGRRNDRYRRRSYGDRSGEPNGTAHDEPPRPTSTSTAPTTAYGRRRRNDTTGGRSTSDHPAETAAPERKQQLSASASARPPPSPHGRPGPLGLGLCGRLPRHGVGDFMFNSSSSWNSSLVAVGCWVLWVRDLGATARITQKQVRPYPYHTRSNKKKNC